MSKLLHTKYPPAKNKIALTSFTAETVKQVEKLSVAFKKCRLRPVTSLTRNIFNSGWF